MRSLILRLVVITGSILALLILSVYVTAFPIGATDMVFERQFLEKSDVETLRDSIPEKQLGIAVAYSHWVTSPSGDEITRGCRLPLPLHILYYREKFVLGPVDQAEFVRDQFQSDLRIARVVVAYVILVFVCIACWVMVTRKPGTAREGPP